MSINLKTVLSGNGTFVRGDKVSRRHLKRLLDAGKSVSQAAAIIGIHKSTAYRIRLEFTEINRKQRLDAKLLLAAYVSGLSLRTVAERYHTTSATVYQLLRDLPEYQMTKKRTGKMRSSIRQPKIKKRTGAPRTFDPHAAWCLYRDEPWTTTTLAQHFGVTASTISTSLTALYPDEYPALAARRKHKGAGHPDRRFSREQAMELFREGYSLRQIGQRFHISIAGIKKALATFPDYAEIAATRPSEASRYRQYQLGRMPGNVRPVITPAGRFATSQLAAQRYRVHPPTVIKWINAGKPGWNYIDPAAKAHRTWQKGNHLMHATCGAMARYFGSRHFFSVAAGKRISCLGWYLQEK